MDRDYQKVYFRRIKLAEMKRKTAFWRMTACTLLVLTVWKGAEAQNLQPLEPSGTSGWKGFLGTPSVENAPCISLEQQQEVSLENQRNAQHVHAEHPELPQVDRGGNHPLFIWPTQARAGFDDYGYSAVRFGVDHDPLPNNHVLDYDCGTRTYDWASGNHAGTDVVYWPYGWRQMDEENMEIIAAADGVIINKRDGYFDRMCSNTGSPDWNGIVLEHSDGSESWYWHMKSGTVTAKGIGETVVAGEFLGNAGSSGSSSYPHLHFQVMDANNNVVDPYAGPCNSMNGTESWWAVQPAYSIPQVNHISTHYSTLDNYNCPTPEITYEQTGFNVGDSIIFKIYYRDLDSASVHTMRNISPDGLFEEWSWTSPWPYYATAYTQWVNVVNSTWPTGNWQFQVDYAGTTYSTDFQIGEFNAITENEEGRFRVWPDPANDFLNISLDGVQPGSTLRLYSVQGALVKTVLPMAAVHRMDLNAVADGMYLLELEQNGSRQLQRVVVARQ